MSYCRWSSDDWRCDLYCYEDVSGGWTTHVANLRRVGNIPKVDWNLLSTDVRKFNRQYAAQRASLDKMELVNIGLPHDGETFHDYSLEDFRDRITMLRDAGYSCPDYVLEEIDEEIQERDATPN
ncbi:MAG TPA: hypothetical protein VHY35_13720 [Stellaceae bacterium]|jgi:hypothetical protein|nr:hypothetical protein [Stellaceae bacterium]